MTRVLPFLLLFLVGSAHATVGSILCEVEGAYSFSVEIAGNESPIAQRLPIKNPNGGSHDEVELEVAVDDVSPVFPEKYANQSHMELKLTLDSQKILIWAENKGTNAAGEKEFEGVLTKPDRSTQGVVCIARNQ